MLTDNNLLERCLENDPIAQELLFRKFGPKMYGICLRYVRDKAEADDILQEGFIKVFSKLRDFRGDGSFEGWMRRIFVNTAINHYRSNLHFDNNHIEPGDVDFVENDALEQLFTENVSGDHQIIMKLSNLQPGIYFVEISTNCMKFTRKLIKR